MPDPTRRALVALVVMLAMLAAAGGGGSSASGAVSSPGHASASRLPGATQIRICAAAGPFWPTMTLAVSGSVAWIACKERSSVAKVDLRRGKTQRSVRLDAPVIAVSVGYGSVWALDTSGTLYRIAPTSARVTKRIALGAQAPYNVWIGAGSVWVVDDASGDIIRVAPSRNRVVARIQAGDGPSDLVFRGTSAWIVNHRDRGLLRLDTRTNRITRLSTLQADAPERIAYLSGMLWVTGRGTDLLKVDPETGVVASTIEIGGSGIDVIAAGGALWVPARSAAVDPTGFPTMDALRRVSPDGDVTTVATPTGRLDVHGLATAGGGVWLADNTSGVLYRVPLARR